MGGNNKDKSPLTWRRVKYALDYPTKEIYSKLETDGRSKTIFILKSKKDEASFLRKIQTSSRKGFPLARIGI